MSTQAEALKRVEDIENILRIGSDPITITKSEYMKYISMSNELIDMYNRARYEAVLYFSELLLLEIVRVQNET